MRRKVYNKAADRSFFKRSATKSKKINVNPSLYRGGIRL